MKCPNCETVNEDNAKFCRTCGINLEDVLSFEENEDETHIPTVENEVNYQQNNTNDNGGGSSDWLCCVCLIAIFIVFAIFGH